MYKKSLTFFIGTLLIITLFSGCIEEEIDENELDKTYDEIAIGFITFLGNNNYQNAYLLFNEEMISALTFEQLEELWDYYTTTYGQFQSIQNSHYEPINGYDLVYVNCSFEKGYIIVFRIVFDTQKNISGFWLDEIKTLNTYKAPEYVNNSKFTELNITIGNNPWQLPATLSIPNGNGPFSCVILIHGSGPNDKDETIGPNKPFKDIAWGLATKEIAVLRYDKRTFVYPDKIANDKEFTIKEEIIDDVLQAIDTLTVQSYAPIDEIFILGHSLGGMMAPKIASLNPSISGAILMAAPARNLEDLILDQTKYLYNLDGNIDENEQELIDEIEQDVQKIKTLNISENESVFTLYKSYWEYLNLYHQVEITQNLSMPLLILQGKRDYQVSYEEDYAIWYEIFQQKDGFSFQTYETLNHLFISGEGPPNNTEYLLEGHVQNKVIEDIIDWIKTR